MSFFCTIPEQLVVVASTEYLKRLWVWSVYGSVLERQLSRTGVPMLMTGEHPTYVPVPLFCLKCFHMNKLPQGNKYPVIFSHPACNFLPFTLRPAK